MDLIEFLRQFSGGISTFGLLSLAVYMILSGRLMPRSSVDEIRQDRDKMLAAKDIEIASWRSAYNTEHATNGELGAQVGQLLEYAKTADHLIRSIQNVDKAET